MRNIFNKRIPTILGFLTIVLGIGLTSLLTQQGVIFTGQASPSNEPVNVQIANVTDNSFTVSYTTTDSVLGSLNVGTTTSLGTTVLDDRNSNAAVARNVHTITVTGLNPQTSYLFSITSGQDTFLKDGALYSVETGPTLGSSDTRANLSGKVVNLDGTSPKEALVYLSIPGAQILAAVTKADGKYTIPLNPLRTSDLSSYYSLDDPITAELSVFTGSLSSRASFSTEVSTIPTITLSKNYDFTISSSPIFEPSATSSATELFPTSTPSGSLSNDPQIITPKKDQGFSDDQPLFQGTAQPNEEVEITIQSEVVNTTVLADANGDWSYRPDTSLSPGTHTITIKTKDSFGILKTITQQFVVHASGTQVGESATPSATLAPTTAPTPTATITPSLTITPVATLTPTPTAALAPAGTSAIPAMGTVAIAFILAGSLLFIFTRLRI
ncbi:MAG: Ig-like domain-containing protein [Candidatus Levyibacteriota bacterium]